MSEPKLISPMLDNFMMGDPISDHNGVRCCPAMKRDCDEKYIVKIISVPASPSQLDALLLSGAYPDKEAALSYFHKLSEDISEEVTVLNKLAALEGFLPIECCQIVPMEDGTGFDIYLLSTYRYTLQRQLRRGTMTHLEALNLGLDLCAALAVARRMGYLYTDLKPGNIYVNDTQGYRIGDIGFLNLNSLKYTSLPDRYRSAYTAPEITDAYSELNTTIDIYALGLILYQVFNDGNLPFRDDITVSKELPPPAYADYEMAEIILKACASDPAARWQDPVEMGQALVSYMQRNGAHDAPIIPVQVDEASTENISENTEEPEGLYIKEDSVAENDSADSNITGDTNSNTDNAEEAAADAQIDDPEDILIEAVTEESIYIEDDNGNLTFIEDSADETADEQDASEIEYDEVTEEVSDILQQADDLIAHDAPAPVVQPEPIDVPIPSPTVNEVTPVSDDEEETQEPGNDEAPDDANQEETEITDSAVAEEGDDAEQSDPAENDADEADEEVPVKKRKIGGWIIKTILILLAAAVLVAGVFFYKNFYLQTIDAITLEPGNAGELTVKVLSQVDENELTVICTDTYGIRHTAPVINGKAFFDDLTPNSAYTIKVDIAGFHHLIGNTTAAYSTPEQTEIVQFTAVTGAEDGSAILSFTVNGPEPDEWKITYTADDGAEISTVFTGRMVTLTALTVGKEYSFTLTPVTEMNITGTNTVVHMAKAVVKPEHLVITGCVDNTLTAQWRVAKDADVSGWTVRCYNDSYDETIVVTEPTASFSIPDDNASYTVEVTASGMSVSERTFVSENAITVTDFKIEDTADGKLDLSWSSAADIQTDDWSLQYTVDGSAPKQIPNTADNSVTVSPLVPGCEYRFVLQAADGQAVLGGTHFYTTADAAEFKGYSVSASDMEFKMCLTPSNANWDRYDLSSSDYTTEFTVGEKASFLVRLKRAYDTSSNIIETLFVIRDENGTIVSTSTSSKTWTKMWYRNYCELDIPSIPDTPGNYTISVYFDGAFVSSTAFSVTE